MLVQAIACSLMLACRPSSATFLVPFGLWVLIRDWRRGLLLPAVAVIAYLPWAAMYRAIYGNLLGPGAIGFDVSWTPLANVGGVVFSPGRGLFVYQPWMWVLPLLLRRDVRTDAAYPLPPGWYLFCLAVIAFHVAMVGSWPVWWGGCCWGSRLAAEVVPIVGLLVVRPLGWLMARQWGWLVLGVLLAAGLAVQLPYLYGDGGWWIGTVIDSHPQCFWDWRNPPFLYRYHG
jgi:hypothetical protein